MKAKTGFYAIFLLTFLLFQSCSEDSPVNPEDNNNTNTELASATIGAGGGTIIADDVEFTIPAGSFQSEQKLKILKSGESNPFGGNAASDVFILDGLPTEFSNPITVKMKYTGTLGENAFIAVGENDVYVKSLNAVQTCYQMFSAEDSTGFVTASIPGMSGALGKSDGISSINGDNISLNVTVVAGMASYTSQQGHFKITFPSSVLTQVFDLAEYLEAAYSKLKSIGFKYDKRTNWPVKVTVKPLKSTVYGYTVGSIWGDNYGYMEFNYDKIDAKEDLKVTAGHEFFHLIQALFDNRNRYSKAKSPGPNYWLDEACAVWSEAFYSSSGLSYTPSVFITNAFDIMKGAKTGDSDDAEHYGYGMSSLVKYLTSSKGDGVVSDIYKDIDDNYTPFEAISRTLPVSVGYSWHLFLQKFFSFELYKADYFTPSALPSKAKELDHDFVIQSASDTLKEFSGIELSDLSATIFSVKNQFDGISSNASLEFVCEDGDIQLYKMNTTTCEFIEEKRDTVLLSDFKQIAADGYQIIVVLYNDHNSAPYTDAENMELTIRVLNPMEISFLDFRVECQGYFESITNGVITYYNSSTALSAKYSTDPQVISVNGNTIHCTANFSQPYIPERKINYTVTVVLDNITSPSMIKEFNIVYSSVYNSGEASVTSNQSAAGTNIPFDYENDIGLWFRLEGDISGSLSDYTYQYSSTGGTMEEQKTLLSFDGSQGEIIFVLEK